MVIKINEQSKRFITKSIRQVWLLTVIIYTSSAWSGEPLAVKFPMNNSEFAEITDSSNLQELSQQSTSKQQDDIINSEIDDITRQFKLIHAELEELQHAQKTLTETVNRLAAILETRNADSNKKPLLSREDAVQLNDIDQELLVPRKGSDSAALISATNSAAAKGQKISPEVAYKDAYSALVVVLNSKTEPKNFSKAKTALEEFTQKYPAHALTGNAFYWIGEIYARNKEYEKSAICYLKGYKAGPHGTRASDNLLRLSEVLIKLGKQQEACSTLFKLKSDFPDLLNATVVRMKQAIKGAACNIDK